MIADDVIYFKKILADGLIQPPCLELGVGYESDFILKNVVKAAGIEYVGTDMVPGPAVDYVVNFEEDNNTVQKNLSRAGEYGSVLVLNVLEHTFEPIKVLDNVFEVLRPGGICVIVTPAVWPLHSFPYDCCRLLPNFYEEYCKRRSLELLENYFEYVGKGKVRGDDAPEGYKFPEPGRSKAQLLKSRIVHKVFDTSARTMFFPSHIAIGVVIRKPTK